MPSSITEEIKKSVRNGLSLECDAKLLQYMELISNKVINRAKTTSKNLDTMSSELQRTSISLDNVTNSLSSLSHTKFIENRVYDDDETIANIKEVPVENKSKEYNPIKTLNTVIKNNMKMLDNCYEKVSVELDDSDEEDEQIKSIVYRPKNKFETRPIPHLIGSKEWKENWHIGIYDSDESFSENDNEEFSDGSLPSNGPISESGSSLWSINHNNSKSKLQSKKTDYTSSDEEISTTSKTSSNDTKQKILPHISSVHEQRFYVHQPKEKRKGLFDESSESENENNKIDATQNKDTKVPEPLPRKSQQQPVKSKKISNIFNDEPPEFDGIVEQTQKGKDTLFFDSDEGELFNQNEHKKQNSAQNLITQSDNVRKKTVNLFDDDDFNSFIKALDQKTNEIDAKRNIKLFEDETEEEIKPIENVRKVNEKKGQLFDGQTENEINSNTSSNLNKNIVQSVSDSKKKDMNLHTNLFEDEDEPEIKPIENVRKVNEKKGQLFDGQTKNKINSNTSSNLNKNIVQSVSDSKKKDMNLYTNLFEDEDELFSSTIKPIDKLLEKPPRDKNISKTTFANLFDDTPSDDEFDNLFKSSNRIPKESSNIEQKLNSNSQILPNPDSLLQNLKSSLSINKTIFGFDSEDEVENTLEKQTHSPVDIINSTNKNYHNVVLSEEPSTCENTSTVDQNSEQKNILQPLNKQKNSENVLRAKNKSFRDVTVEESENIFNNNITDVIINANEKESKNILSHSFNKKEGIFNNIKPISDSLFDDVPEDDDDFFKSLTNTQKNQKKSEESIKYIKNDIIDCNFQTAQHKTKQNYLFENQSNETLEKVKVLDYEQSNTLSNNDKLPNLFLENSTPNDKNFLEKSNNDNLLEDVDSEVFNKNNHEKKVEDLNNTVRNKLLNSNNDPHNDSHTSNNSETVEEIENIIQSNKEIVAENIPNVNDIKTEINDFTRNSLNKSNVHSVFMPTIFDDTPPDDDDIFSSSNKNNFNEVEIFEATTDNYNFNQTQNISNYDSVVFQDTTPPDDTTPPNHTTPRDLTTPPENLSTNNQKNDEFITSSIFDNTFSDITNQKTEFSSNLLFDNEPPTDPFDYKEDKFDEKVNRKESEIIKEQSLSVSDLIKKASTANKDNDTRNINSKTSIGSKKLSTNININVAALLPGAKRPIISNINKDESDGNIPTKNQSLNLEEESNTDRNKKNIESKGSNLIVDKESRGKQPEHNILISLNKNRVTIPTRRRPSTKQGRLENYRKSITDTEIEKNVKDINISCENIDENNKTVGKEVIKNISKQNSNSLFSDEVDDDGDWLTKSINNKEVLKKQENKNENIFQSTVKNDSSDKNQVVLNKSGEQSKKKSSFSFTATNDNDEDDWLFKTTSKSNSEEAKAQNKNVGGLSKNLSNFESTAESTIPNSNKAKSKNNSLLLPNQTKSKGKEELLPTEKSNDYSLFKEDLIEKNAFKSTTKSKTKKVDDSLLFDADNENDLFSGNSVTRNKNATENNIDFTEKLPNIENEHEIFKKIKIYKKKPTKNEPNSINKTIEKVTKAEKLQNKSRGLFDSDDDETIPVKEAIEKIPKLPEISNNKSIGLFDSEDDDDDLFGNNSSTKKLTIKKNTSSLEANKKVLNVPKRNNLFDDIDDDDDDDLFGTKNNKAQTAVAVTRKNVEKPKIIQSHGESTDYNPLAD